MSKKREEYGFVTAVSMVVGSVIGSGVFFKAEIINRITGENLINGTLAWIMGGGVMLLCLLSFAAICRKYGEAQGLVGYAEKIIGNRYAYYTSWFMLTVYYPSMVSVLSWLSARYTLAAAGTENFSGGMCMLLSCIYLSGSFAVNTLSPNITGKIQVVTTFVKLIPLVLISILGVMRGGGVQVLANSVESEQTFTAVFPATVASAFAYEGWITATNISGKLKNSHKNLPRALVVGGVIVLLVYVAYYVGVSSIIGTTAFKQQQKQNIQTVYEVALGKGSGRLLVSFVAISCIGALNGLMYGCVRAMSALRHTSVGTGNEMDEVRGDFTSAVIGLILSMGWLLYYFGTQITPHPIFSQLLFDSSEMPIITTYAMYVPIFVAYAKKHAKENIITNLLLPVGAIGACVFMVYSAVIAHKNEVIDYIFAYVTIMLAGAAFMPGKLSRIRIESDT